MPQPCWLTHRSALQLHDGEPSPRIFKDPCNVQEALRFETLLLNWQRQVQGGPVCLYPSTDAPKGTQISPVPSPSLSSTGRLTYRLGKSVHTTPRQILSVLSCFPQIMYCPLSCLPNTTHTYTLTHTHTHTPCTTHIHKIHTYAHYK